MKYYPQSRRHFLQGLGGSLMTLPLLTSLLPRQAAAQAVKTQKFFVLITVDHGGTGFSKDWYPAPFIDNLNSNQFTKATLIPSGGQNGIPHIIRHGRLASFLSTDPGHDGGNVDNNQQRLSFILGSFLNPYVNKLNMFAGLDGGMTYYGHTRSVPGGSIFGLQDPKTWPTVDHFLAHSPRFYLNPESIALPVFNQSPYSWTQTGANYPSTGGSVSKAYEALFSRYQGTRDPAVVARQEERTYLIDRVLEDFNRTINGNTSSARRISEADRQRLKQHAQYMFEVERKFRNLVNSCSDVQRPPLPKYNGFWTPYYSDNRFNAGTTNAQEDYNKAWDALTDLLALAFSCGATQLANLAASNGFFLHSGDYHQDIAHQCTNSRSAQLTHNRNIRWQAEHLFGAMVRKLDAIDVGNGQTLLDRGLVTFMHEAGTTTHNHYNLGCVTAGSVDGFFNTGNFVDFRNLENLGLLKDYSNPENKEFRPGVPLQRFYANVLQAYGHTPADYRRNNRPGYGADQTAPSYAGTRHNPNRHVPYPTEMVNSFDQLLPVIAKG